MYSSLQLSFFIYKTEGISCGAVSVMDYGGSWRNLTFHIFFEWSSLPGTIKSWSSGEKGKSQMGVEKEV